MQYNDSRGRGNQQAINNFTRTESLINATRFDQQTRLRSVTQGYGVNANYTEPLSKRSCWNSQGFSNSSLETLDRNL